MLIQQNTVCVDKCMNGVVSCLLAADMGGGEGGGGIWCNLSNYPETPTGSGVRVTIRYKNAFPTT